MARTKPLSREIRVISDQAGVNAALAEIATVKRGLAAIESSLNERIDGLKAEADAEAAPLKAQLLVLDNAVAQYAEYHKDELFGKKRSLELVHGVIGYRRSAEIKPKSRHTWKMILARIKELGLPAVRVREDVDREALQGWPEERLDLVGAHRVEKDTFWYELKEEALQECA